MLVSVVVVLVLIVVVAVDADDWLVRDLPLGTFTHVVAKLRHGGTQSKSTLVEMAIMPPHSTKTSPLFQITIDCLVSGSCCRLGSAIRFIHDHVLVATTRIASVTTIALHHLARQEPMLQIAPKNGEVGPSSTLERPIDPANVSRLDAHANLASQASLFVLVREPNAAKRNRLSNAEIRTVHSHLAHPPFVLFETIA